MSEEQIERISSSLEDIAKWLKMIYEQIEFAESNRRREQIYK